MQLGSLPSSNEVNVGVLAGIFGNVTNSYKFYWCHAILDAIHERHQQTVSLYWLLCRMVALVWYPVHYFRLQFGKADMLSQVARTVMQETGLPINASVEEVTVACLRLAESSAARKELEKLGRFVPYRFIRPFFETETRGLLDQQVNKRVAEIATQQFTSSRPPMYRVMGDEIELAQAWFAYAIEHLEILRGFTNWKLVLYLQSKNPNIGNIASKLNAPIARDLAEAKRFWQAAFANGLKSQCIYSGRDIPPSRLSLDHFLPWSFVAHDALWNICPTVAEVNSSKGDRIPSLDLYLNSFVNLQFDALHAVIDAGPDSMFEDYAILFTTASKKDLVAIARGDFIVKMENVIRPQVQIATNCGFPSAWKFGL